jgi:acyl carrier protein
MQQTEIETAFAELLERITGFHPAPIGRDLHLDKLGLDSLAKIDLAVAAEDRFGIAIPDEDLERHCHVNIGLAAWNQSDDVAPIMRRTGRSSPAAKY